MTSREKAVCTVINRFTMAPEDQQALADILTTDIMPTLAREPGFLSTKLHRSTDGTRLVQVTEWRMPEDHFACMKSPRMASVGRRMMTFLEFGKAAMEVHTYDLIFASGAD